MIAGDQQLELRGIFEEILSHEARGDFVAALNYANSSLDANAFNVRAYGLKSAALRHLGRVKEAREVVGFAQRKTDPLDVRLMAEQWLATKNAASGKTLFATLNNHPANAQEIAAELTDLLHHDDRVRLECIARFAGLFLVISHVQRGKCPSSLP